MPASDTFLTITESTQATYTEKRSRFIALAFPIDGVDAVKTIIDKCRKDYFDARHVCYAYMLGAERTVFRANDDGEPSGTAGKPILGQINRLNLTDILLVVVRYFGGIKLGTSGLLNAYRTAAAEALSSATIEERIIEEAITITCPYPRLNDAMRIIHSHSATLRQQTGEGGFNLGPAAFTALPDSGPRR